MYLREIDDVIYEYPAAAEASVIGIPHETLGEEVGAAAVPKAGVHAQPEELHDFVKQRVPEGGDRGDPAPRHHRSAN